LGTAIITFFSVFFSVVLAGFGFQEILANFRRKIPAWRAVLATFLAAVPLLAFLLFDVLHFKLKSLQSAAPQIILS